MAVHDLELFCAGSSPRKRCVGAHRAKDERMRLPVIINTVAIATKQKKEAPDGRLLFRAICAISARSLNAFKSRHPALHPSMQQPLRIWKQKPESSLDLIKACGTPDVVKENIALNMRLLVVPVHRCHSTGRTPDLAIPSTRGCTESA